MARTTYAVIDATVTKTEARFRGLAAKYVQWALEQAHAPIVDARDADIVLATMVSPHEYEYLPRALKRHKVEPLAARRLRQKVILGGQGALSPAVFDPYIDAACVGEGKNFLATLLNDGFDAARKRDNAWVPGETRPVIPDDDFPWDAPPTMAEDGVVRIYASRSCKKKCLFCHTGWATTYRETDDEARLLKQYAALTKAGYRVNVVTNDAPALSFFDDLTAMEHFSASYSQTQEMIKTGITNVAGKVKSLRFGVEAPSTRLRKIVGKPIDSYDLLALSAELLNAGVGVRWFMIAGLPGETTDDWDELRDIVIKARHIIKKGALQLSFTAFCPDAAAPLCLAPLDDGYHERFTSFWKWYFDGPGFTRKVQLLKCAGPESRLRHAIGSMAATEDELRRGWLDRDPPNWRVQYPLTHTARRAYNVYARRVGLPLSVDQVSR
jgi:hypothetical protein